MFFFGGGHGMRLIGALLVAEANPFAFIMRRVLCEVLALVVNALFLER